MIYIVFVKQIDAYSPYETEFPTNEILGYTTNFELVKMITSSELSEFHIKRFENETLDEVVSYFGECNTFTKVENCTYELHTEDFLMNSLLTVSKSDVLFYSLSFTSRHNLVGIYEVSPGSYVIRHEVDEFGIFSKIRNILNNELYRYNMEVLDNESVIDIANRTLLNAPFDSLREMLINYKIDESQRCEMKLYALYDYYSTVMTGATIWYITDDARLLEVTRFDAIDYEVRSLELQSITLEDAINECKTNYREYDIKEDMIRKTGFLKFEDCDYYIEFGIDGEYTRCVTREFNIPIRAYNRNQYRLYYTDYSIMLFIPNSVKSLKERAEQVIDEFEKYSFISDTEQATFILSAIMRRVFSELTMFEIEE